MKKNQKPIYSLMDTIQKVVDMKPDELTQSVLFHLEQMQKMYANGGNCHFILSLNQDDFENFMEYQNRCLENIC